MKGAQEEDRQHSTSSCERLVRHFREMPAPPPFTRHDGAVLSDELLGDLADFVETARAEGRSAESVVSELRVGLSAATPTGYRAKQAIAERIVFASVELFYRPDIAD